MFLDDIQYGQQTEESVTDKVYEDQTLQEGDLSKVEYHNVTFLRCDFQKSDFHGGSFYQCRFQDCNLSKTKFTDCYFKECQFINCKADESNFSQSTLIQSGLILGSYHYGNFGGTLWQGSSLAGCDCQDGFFSEVRFKKSKLKDVNLSRVDFFKTSLNGVNLSQCTIAGLMVSDSFKELRGARISAVQALDLVTLLGVKVD